MGYPQFRKLGKKWKKGNFVNNANGGDLVRQISQSNQPPKCHSSACKLRCKHKTSVYIRKGGPKAGCTKKFCTLHMTGFRHWSASVVGISKRKHRVISLSDKQLRDCGEISYLTHPKTRPQHPKVYRVYCFANTLVALVEAFKKRN